MKKAQSIFGGAVLLTAVVLGMFAFSGEVIDSSLAAGVGLVTSLVGGAIGASQGK